MSNSEHITVQTAFELEGESTFLDAVVDNLADTSSKNVYAD